MKKSIKKLSAVLLSVAILLISVIPAFAADSEISGKNWMGNLSDSKKITEITVPGTHDSCTKYVDFSFISKTQSLSIYEQLNAGVRYFDMRFRQEKNEFISVHSISNCRTGPGPFADRLTSGLVINDCKKFLKENPTETILFQLKVGDGDEHSKDFYSVFYDKYIAGDKDSWFIENRIPSLEEVRGKIVLLRVPPVDTERFDDTNSGINFSTYPRVPEPEVINFKRSDITKLSDKSIYSELYVQDSFKLKPEEKWTAVKTFIEQDLNSDNFNICLSSYTGSKMPEGNAKDMNPRILSYNFQKGGYYGILVTDFVTDELAEKIYMTNDFAENNIPETDENPKSETSKDETPSIPETGDINGILISVSVLSVIAAAVIVIIKKKK